MTPFNYNKLSKSAQISLLEQEGTLLVKINKYTLSLELYQVRDVYVEVFRRIHSREALTVYAFSGVENLDPYLERVDISGIHALL